MAVIILKFLLKIVAGLCFVLIFSYSVFAQTDSVHIRTTPEMRAEIYNVFEQSSKKITELDKTILKYLNSVKKPKAAAYKKSYVDSQNGWLNYRDGHCQIISDESADAPTGPDQFFYQCIADINARRIEELNELLINFKLEFGALKME
ncbi:lysozyme inhibitor LprI family protein [Adhaeribacter terreus]|uniref:Lysozyme inhibitor LprI family protein n=1 Tax=Adhaeribacter terreus TaxID=529703 RepID=A0ABW0EB55_9BACT